MPLFIRVRQTASIPLEVDSVRLETVREQSADDVKRTLVQHGNKQVELGEFFDVEGSAAEDDTIVWQGDCSRVKLIGEKLAGGVVRVEGDAGMHLGAEMSAGEITVTGNTADWTGAEMHGGRIHVHGNAGHLVGAAYRGGRRGMTGGEIFINGSAGNEIGLTMRRGLIAVAGRIGDAVGFNMIAGTVLTFSGAGIRPGAGMRRGTIGLFGESEIPDVLPTFRYANRIQPLFLKLYFDRLKSAGFPVADEFLTASFDRYCGRVTYSHLTFEQLDRESDRLARGLAAIGIQPGSRIVLMVRPGLEFIALTFALFKAGAVIVLIDPGMGRTNIFHCLKEVDPAGFVAIPIVQAIRIAKRKLFPNAKLNATVGRRWFWGGPNYGDLLGDDWTPFEIPTQSPTEPAAIIFTSGSTGPPKGVLYEHGMFAAQVDLLRDFYAIEPGEIDLPGFPLFALFNSAMGVTTVIPDMDPTKPAQVDPQKIITAIRDQGVTQAFGSPAMWNRIGRYCEQQEVTLPSLRRVLSAGAPVPVHVLKRIQKMLTRPDADIHTPYGATESLPVCSISGCEVLEDTAAQTSGGAGTCVGRPFPQLEVKVVAIDDEPIASIDAVVELPAGEIGEIVVRGPSTTQEYYRRPEATAEAKVPDGEKRKWHRMGDVGYFDEGGRLWFCGRKAHIVHTAGGAMFPVRCEAIFNEHADVYRSALVSRLIYTSSPSVIYDGNSHEGVDESIGYPPEDSYLCHYPRSKAIAEKAVLAANGENGLATVALRPHLIWGLRDNHLIPRLIRRAQSGRLRRVGDGKNLISMTHVENAAIAHVQAAENLSATEPHAGRAYFINEPDPVNLWDWIDELLERAGVPKLKKRISATAAWRIGGVLEAVYRVLRLPGEPPMTRFLASQLSSSHYYDISAAQRDFGYEPAISVEEGMRALEPELKRLAAGR
eukprot:g21957.t1